MPQVAAAMSMQSSYMPQEHWAFLIISIFAAPIRMPLRRNHVKPISVARNVTRGTEARRSTAWEHHHPTPDDPAPAVRVAPEAIGTPHAPVVLEERAAPQHPENSLRGSQIFPIIIRCIGIFEARYAIIFPPQTARPFPHVPRPLQT